MSRHDYDTNLIEVTVRGGVGCGKSEVLEVIKMALESHYVDNSSSRVKIAGKNPDGAIEEAKITGQTAKKKNTVFVLYEKMPGQ